MIIELYNNMSETHRLNKSLELIATLNGTLRTGCSLLNPQIIIQFNPEEIRKSIAGGYVVDDDGIRVIDDDGNKVVWSYLSKCMTANYVRIPDFNRYYFIDEPSSVHNLLWELTLKVDTLMSYRIQIGKTSALIARNEFDYDTKLEDQKIFMEYGKSVTETEIIPANKKLTPSDTFIGYTRELDGSLLPKEEGSDSNNYLFDVSEYIGKTVRIAYKWDERFSAPNNQIALFNAVLGIQYGYYNFEYSDVIYVKLDDNRIKYVSVNTQDTCDVSIVDYVSFDDGLTDVYAGTKKCRYNILLVVHDPNHVQTGQDTGLSLNSVLNQVNELSTEMVNDNIFPCTMVEDSLPYPSQEDVSTLLDYIAQHESLASYVLNMMVLPFKFPVILSSSTGIVKQGCVLGSDTVNATLYAIDRSNYIFCHSEFTISSTGSFMDYDPYSKYEVFVPFCSWITLDGSQILDKTLKLYYLLNYTDGSAFAFIVDTTSDKLIWGSSCNLGLKIPLSVTNAQEIANQKLSNTLNLILGIVSSSINIVGGAVAKNAIPVAQGVMGIGSSIGEYITKDMQMYEKASCNIAGGNSGLYAPQNVRIRVTRSVPHDYDENFAHTYGLPLNAYRKIGDLSGMTIVGEVHLEGFDTATSQELVMIENQLKAGILI